MSTVCRLVFKKLALKVVGGFILMIAMHIHSVNKPTHHVYGFNLGYPHAQAQMN